MYVHFVIPLNSLPLTLALPSHTRSPSPLSLSLSSLALSLPSRSPSPLSLSLSSLALPLVSLSLSQLREVESTRWQLAQGGERATITQEEQSALQKEIQEQEALLQGYQKVGREGGRERERERGRCCVLIG